MHEPLAAAENAALLLERFRSTGAPVIHVRNEAVHRGATFLVAGTEGTQFHPLVEPRAGEIVVTKHYPNSFRETNLQRVLEECSVEKLVVAGKMTHMCVSTTVRAAWDAGWSMTLVADACATRSLEYGGVEVGAEQVHLAHVAALERFARLSQTDSLLQEESASFGLPV